MQQALALLRNQGVRQDAPRRGLHVAPLEPELVQHKYDIRAAIEGFAARRTAELGAQRAAKAGPMLIEAGCRAAAAGSVAKVIAADIKFHEFIYALSGNPLIASALEAHLGQDPVLTLQSLATSIAPMFRVALRLPLIPPGRRR